MDYEKEVRNLLRHVLTDKDIDVWLHRPNSQLDGRTPQSVIDEGRGKIIVDFAHDMITGQPT
jgi:uncharacterized protein (DUF2384 family)